MNMYKSEVWILFFKIPCEEFSYSNLDHARKNEDLILKSLRPIFRPFAKIRWVKEPT